MKQDYVVVKQLPDAGVGTIVRWNEENGAYIYPKSIPVYDKSDGNEWIMNVLTKEQVQENKEFFAPMDKAYKAGVDSNSDSPKLSGNPVVALKEAMDEKESQRKRASHWEDRASEYKKNEKHYREHLHETHALIGRLIHYMEGRVDKVNISKYFDKPNW